MFQTLQSLSLCPLLKAFIETRLRIRGALTYHVGWKGSARRGSLWGGAKGARAGGERGEGGGGGTRCLFRFHEAELSGERVAGTCLKTSRYWNFLGVTHAHYNIN